MSFRYPGDIRTIAQHLVLTEPRPMKQHDASLSAREKIQDVLNVLSSKEVPLGPNNRYTQAEMIAWCESWIKIYERLPKAEG
jgi:hypothetical protein